MIFGDRVVARLGLRGVVGAVKVVRNGGKLSRGGVDLGDVRPDVESCRAVRVEPRAAPVRRSIIASEKPSRLQRRRASGARKLAERAQLLSGRCTMVSISRRNQGSIRVSALTFSTLWPRAKRLRDGEDTARRRVPQFLRPGRRTRKRPDRDRRTPMSSMRRAFCRASGNVRPMAMTSPTLFISLPSCFSEPPNLVRSQRGILQTM